MTPKENDYLGGKELLGCAEGSSGFVEEVPIVSGDCGKVLESAESPTRVACAF